MDIEKIVQELNQRFEAPLPEFYKRRIVFWLDEEKEFEDKIDDIELENAKVVKLTGSNSFAMKKLLTSDDPTSNYVVYQPFGYDDLENDWLLNIKLYSEEFRSDLLSLWIEEMHLPATPGIRKAVKGYRKFFNSKERRAKVAAFSEKKAINTPPELHLAVMAVICSSKPSPDSIIRAVLCSLNGGADVYSNIISYDAETAFGELIKRGTGYSAEKTDLPELAAHILLTAAAKTMRSELLEGLERYFSEPHQSYCYDLISDWLHSDDLMQLYDIARRVEDELKLPQRFESMLPEYIADTECLPCINECILTKLMSEVSEHTINVKTIISIAEKRRTKAWYDFVENYYDGLIQIANMQEFCKENSEGFHTVDPAEVWEKYTKKYYKMDTYYRLFHLAFAQSLKSPVPEFEDQFKSCADVVEGLYKNTFLNDLGSNWTNACADDLREHGFIQGVEKQQDFYRDKIASADNRVFVIISDAMRYEVAASLCEQLRRETQAQVEIGSMQAIFPTITKFGMAALLPHKDLTVEIHNEKLSVLADGILTESNYRDKILKSADPDSIALKSEAVISVKRAERSEWVKGKNVVYIYHNTIDEASHNSDTSVFPACEDAINEIKNLIRIIVNDFGGVNVIVTADHGFLYTYSPLTESEKVDKTSFKGKDVEYGRRYAILEKGTAPEYLMPVKFLDSTSELEAFAPRESIRIKMNGGGMNFVHGGISLQEMVVPVIEYHFLRNAYKEYKNNRSKYDTKPVTLSLLSASRKISNKVFSLSFYQQDAVGENREPATYQLYFEDREGSRISDVQKVIADKKEQSTADRTFRCTFNLKSLPYDKPETYYLVIADESGLTMPQREEFTIDIPLAADDYNFF